MATTDSPLAPLWRFLDSSFPLGRFFGVRVRVYGAWLIVLLLVVLPLKDLRFLGWSVLLYVGLGVVLLYATVWLHEMGHVVAGWRWRIPTDLITLSPLGGLAHMQRGAPHPRAELVIALAGPLTHLLTLAVAWPLTVLVGGRPFAWSDEIVPYVLARVVELNLGLLLFNLLPLYPMDGGRALRAILAMRVHVNRATLIVARLGSVGAFALGIVGLFVLGKVGGGVWGGLLISIAISNWSACRQAMLEARYSDGPYQALREPWEEDPDAWKQGGEPEDESPRPQRTARPARDEGPSESELDRLLDRVSEVGLAGLTSAERDALQRASVARRSR